MKLKEDRPAEAGLLFMEDISDCLSALRGPGGLARRPGFQRAPHGLFTGCRHSA